MIMIHGRVLLSDVTLIIVAPFAFFYISGQVQQCQTQQTFHNSLSHSSTPPMVW